MVALVEMWHRRLGQTLFLAFSALLLPASCHPLSSSPLALEENNTTTTTAIISNTTFSLSPSTLNDTDSDANAVSPDFERLIHVGLANLQRDRPNVDLLLVTNLAINRIHHSSDEKKFRHVGLLGYDRTQSTYVRTQNIPTGQNIWLPVENIVDPPAAIVLMRRFDWDRFPINFKRAFQIVREQGLMQEWRSVTVRRATTQIDNVQYIFSKQGHVQVVAVDVMTGDCRRVNIESEGFAADQDAFSIDSVNGTGITTVEETS